MTEADFRRMVLALDGAVEGAHMGHPDFASTTVSLRRSAATANSEW